MAKTQTMNKALVFPKAGHIKVTPYNAQGELDVSKMWVSTHNIVKSIKRANSTTTSELPDGNSLYPAAEYATKEEGTLTVGFSTYDPTLEATVKGAEYTEDTEAASVFERIESFEIPESGAITLKYAVKDENFAIHIHDSFGNVFTQADGSTPAAGTFKATIAESGEKIATLTFATEDAGTSVYVSYESYTTGVSGFAYDETPKTPMFQVVIIGETKAYATGQTMDTNITIDRASLSGGITPPEQTNDPTGGWEIAFKIGKPRPGYKPVDVKFAPAQ
ncbi:MAG: hypothetical protein SOY88_05735 [Massilioclostridium sp.]|nr:hypothetical protein [Massilioclostridium sp.]